MTLKVDVETVDALRRRLAVEVPAEAVSAELDKTFSELARSARVPGFRRGRAPRHVMERLFGDRVRVEVFERLIHASYAEAIATQHLPAVGHPEIVTEQAQPGAALRYSATVEVRPEVVVDQYLGLEGDRPEIVVNETDIDAVVERLRQSHAQLHPIIDRTTIQFGDVVSLGYEARVAGRLAGRAESRDVEIGRNGFPPEFDAKLLGAEVGSEHEFDVAYTEDHATAELAGTTVHFRVQVRGLSCKELPAVDDEFAKDHGECATVAELRQRIQQRLEADAARQADEVLRRALLTKLAERHDVPVPRALVERRTEALMEDVWQQWQQQRRRPKNEAAARERLREELEPRAREQVKLSLLLDAVAQLEHMTVSDAEVQSQIDTMVEQSGSAAEQVRALYQDPAARHQLQISMLQSRAVDVIVHGARVRHVRATAQIADAVENG